MDHERFDTFARSLTETHSRRRLTRLLGGLTLAGPLAVLGPAEAPAKRKKKKKKKRTAPTVTVPPTSSPPAPTCSDSVKNGSETDVDCGGTCPKCASGKACQVGSDCTSGFCDSQICRLTCPERSCSVDVTCINFGCGTCNQAEGKCRNP